MAGRSKKLRVPIPPDVAARVLFNADRTCCVCRQSGKPVQIHHIDEDPANNHPTNLAALCLECHDATQLRGGFGRKLDSDQVILFRDDWNRVVLNRRFAQYEESATRLEYAAERITYTTTVAERLRENGEFELLAMLYNSIGNTELRDKYIDLALDQSPSDDSICFLRGMQGRPDLIPPDVAERRLERQEELADWTQRARTLMSLGRPVEAARDYVRGILHSLENENPFGAAYYLKELVRRDIIDALLATALAQAAAADDLWWQIRALQELGWGTELDALVVEHADEIEESGNSRMLVLLRRAEGREEEATTLDIALTAGRRRVIVDGESFVGEPVGEGQDDP